MITQIQEKKVENLMCYSRFVIRNFISLESKGDSRLIFKLILDFMHIE